MNGAFRLGAIAASGRALKGGGDEPDQLDPHWDNVQALLHFDGSDESESFVDQKGHGFLKVSGSPQLDATQKKFGPTSLWLPGTDAAIETVSSADFGLNQGAWTVEFWIFLAQLPNANREIVTFSQGPSLGISYHALALHINPSNVLNWYNGSNNGVTSFQFTADSWIHIACTRSGASGTPVRVFVNGSQVGASSATSRSYSPVQIRIGRSSGLGSAGLPCWIDDFRFTNGVARYTEDFTPPDAPFPNS